MDEASGDRAPSFRRAAQDNRHPMEMEISQGKSSLLPRHLLYIEETPTDQQPMADIIQAYLRMGTRPGFVDIDRLPEDAFFQMTSYSVLPGIDGP